MQLHLVSMDSTACECWQKPIGLALCQLSDMAVALNYDRATITIKR